MTALIPDANASPAPLTSSLAEDGDHELWLVRVPRHSVLRKSLVGKDITLGDPDAPNQVRGNYYFADEALTPAARAIRPALVAPAPAGGPVAYKLGPRFTRQVSVTFAGSAMVPVGARRAARTYPEAPTGLRVKYRPLGPHTGPGAASGEKRAAAEPPPRGGEWDAGGASPATTAKREASGGGDRAAAANPATPLKRKASRDAKDRSSRKRRRKT
jgi:hypothetical protein